MPMPSNIGDGEIIFKEKYGSSKKEIIYVKPPDQQTFVALQHHHRDVGSWLKRVFLPQGYPHSVSKDYAAYQVWDTAQAFCSTITGTLATQEVLRGVGVGSTDATPLAATVTWVVKDGCGHIGRILFAYSHGSYLDAYSKKWRLYADTLNDAAMCMEIALPLFRDYTTAVLCISTVMKAIVGVAGGATRAAMTQHHAVRGNMADVSAKDSAQETAVNLVASFVALFIISTFGNSLAIFVLMLVLHIVFNYMAVRAVCLRTLNEPRLLLLVDLYLRREATAAPCAINAQEPMVFYQFGANLLDRRLCGFEIKLGSSLKHIVKHYPKAVHLTQIKDVYSETKYLIFPSTNNRIMYVVFKDQASTDDMLCAYFHAVLLSVFVCAINDVQLPIYNGSEHPRPFTRVCHIVQGAEWSRRPPRRHHGRALSHEPTTELMQYTAKIAGSEWRVLREALLKTGWDLSKHLLIVDEWRVRPESKTHLARSTSAIHDHLHHHDHKTNKRRPFQDVDRLSEQSFDSTTIEPEITESQMALTKKGV